MKTSIHLTRTLTIVAGCISVMVTVGCGLIPNPVIPRVSTSPPPAPTSAPPSRSPFEGHWEGTGPSVSFDVTADGNISNFRMTARIGTPTQSCTFGIDRLPIMMNADGTFVISYSMEYADVEAELGRAVMSLGVIPKGQPYEVLRISGNSSDTTLSGTFKITVCNHALLLGNNTGPWKAERKGDASSSTSVSAAQPTTPPIETVRIVTENWTPTAPNTPRPTAGVAPTRVPTKAAPTASPAAPTSVPPPSGSWLRITTLPRQINSFAADPSNPQVVYAGTGQSGSGSGVYKSEDRGKTWRNASKGLPNEDVTALAFGRIAPFTLYAMVGVRGDMYASSDNSESWARVGNTGLSGGFWHRLVTSPGNNNVLFALALGSGMARSSDGGHAWTPIRRGIPSDQTSVRVQSLGIDPSNANVMYLGTGGHVGGGAGVYQSTDGGTNWSPANQGMLDYRITALALDPTRPQTIYAGSDAGELFRTKDSAQTWEDLTDSLPFPRGRHIGIRQILIDPITPAKIYLLCDQTGVLMSSDGGATWDSLGKPPEGDSYYIHGAAMVLYGDRPVILLGDERSGPWSYAAQ